MPGDNARYEWIHTVDYEDFDVKVIAASHERPVLVDLWAQWCSPCVVIAPVLERFARTARKQGTGILVISQSPEDIHKFGAAGKAMSRSRISSS